MRQQYLERRVIPLIPELRREWGTQSWWLREWVLAWAWLYCVMANDLSHGTFVPC